MKDIDYATLYGIHPGEFDFSSAIERSLKTGVKHLDKIFMESVQAIKEYRKLHLNKN